MSKVTDLHVVKVFVNYAINQLLSESSNQRESCTELAINSQTEPEEEKAYITKEECFEVATECFSGPEAAV